MIYLEVALRELGRCLELRPGDWPLACRAFEAATDVRRLRAEILR